MTLEIVSCNTPSIESFCSELRSRGKNIVSLEDTLGLKGSVENDFFVVCKIVKQIHSLEPEANNKITLVVKEVLPDHSYGDHFFAYIFGQLSISIQRSKLEPGDRLAFLRPQVVTRISDDSSKLGKRDLKYCLKYGETDSDWIFCAKKTEYREGVSLTNKRSIQTNENTKKFKVCEIQNSDKQTKGHNNNNALDTSVQSSSENTLDEKINLENKRIDGQKTKSTLENKAVQNNIAKTTNEKTSLGNKSESGLNTKNTVVKKDGQINAENSPSKKTNLESKNAQNNGQSTDKAHTAVKNSLYSYKTLSNTKADALKGDLSRVNLYCAVAQILKPLSRISSGKFTLILAAVDESLKNDQKLTIHFFTKEDDILKEITQGDVLRLHRVKMELFENDTDGRIFNSTDVTLFKQSTQDFITIAKNSTVSESEKSRANGLKTWFRETYIPLIFSNSVQLSEISSSGCYKLFFKVVGVSIADELVKFRITDGTVLEKLSPLSPLVEGNPKTVSEITIPASVKGAKTIQVNDYLLINQVKVTESDSGFTLSVDTNESVSLTKISQTLEKSQEVERRLEKHAVKSNGASDGNLVANVETENQTKENAKKSPIKENSRQEQNQRTSSCVTLVSSSVTKSLPVKRTSVGTTRDTRSSGDSSLGKPRKALFTANNGDWSDATDEASEHSPPPTKCEESTVLPPSNSFADLFGLIVKDQYCCLRKLSTPEAASAKGSTSGNEMKSPLPSDRGSVQNNKLQPFVKVDKLPDNYSLTAVKSKKPDEGIRLDSTASIIEVEEDDTSTVVNMSYQQGPENSSKKVMLADEVRDQELTPTVKVSSWLLNNDNNPVVLASETEQNELSYNDIKCLISAEEDLSFLINSAVFHIQVFVDKILPKADGDECDWVSGYCQHCHRLYRLSTLQWEKNRSLCPSCFTDRKKMDVMLMFVLELCVFDSSGTYFKVLICQEQAEIFLDCSVKDFLISEDIRRSRVQFLNSLCFVNEVTHQRPILNISVKIFKNQACLVSSRLKLPQSSSVSN